MRISRSAVGRSPRIVLGSLLLAVGLTVSFVVASALQGSAATSAAASTYTNATFGFQLTLPDGWRQSTLLSSSKALDARLLAWDVFTSRSTTEEAAAAQQGTEQLPAAWQWVVEVEVWSNPTGLTALAWANDPNLAGWTTFQKISAVTIDGRAAARQLGGPQHAISYYVSAKGYMFRVGYYTGLSSNRPVSANDATLQTIPQSFHVQ